MRYLADEQLQSPLSRGSKCFAFKQGWGEAFSFASKRVLSLFFFPRGKKTVVRRAAGSPRGLENAHVNSNGACRFLGSSFL